MASEIVRVLMRRDKMSLEEALDLIAEAKEMLHEYLENGQIDRAENVCQEYFGLEPDYLMELLD